MGSDNEYSGLGEAGCQAQTRRTGERVCFGKVA